MIMLTNPLMRRLAVTSLGAILLTGCASGCGQTLQGQTTAPASTPQAQVKGIAVQVIKATKANLERSITQPGQVQAIESAPLFSRTAGVVVSVQNDIGDNVKKGQVLIELDAPELVADRHQKEASVKEAEANRDQFVSALQVAKLRIFSAEAKQKESEAAMARADAEIARWRSESQRTDQLAKSRAVTPSLAEENRSKLAVAIAARGEVVAQTESAKVFVAESQSLLKKAEADLKAAESRIMSARADLEKSMVFLGFGLIKAPFDGTIIQRSVDRGHLVAVGPTPAPLLTLARTDQVTISVGVPEVETPWVQSGDPVRLTFESNSQIIESKISRIAKALDPNTRTMLAEIDLANSERALQPGQLANVQIMAESRKDVWTLPSSSVLTDKTTGKTFCWVAEAGRAVRKNLQLGLTQGRLIEIIAGITDADQVVDKPDPALKAGDSVETGDKSGGS